MCLQPRFCSLFLDAFRIDACAGLFSRPDIGAENEGAMNLRAKKNVLSATMIAVLCSRGAVGHPPLKVDLLKF